MTHNIVSLTLKYNYGTTEYRDIFSRYLPWSKINGTAQHYSLDTNLYNTFSLALCKECISTYLNLFLIFIERYVKILQ